MHLKHSEQSDNKFIPKGTDGIVIIEEAKESST